MRQKDLPYGYGMAGLEANSVFCWYGTCLFRLFFGKKAIYRRNGGSKEERHLGTDHLTKRQMYGWLLEEKEKKCSIAFQLCGGNEHTARRSNSKPDMSLLGPPLD